MLIAAGWSTVWNKLKTLVREVRMEQTVFGLPFVYAGALLARGRSLLLTEVFLVTLAVVAARTFAMLMNRLIDREIDKRNPRTQSRALPQGKMKLFEVYFYAFITFSIYLFAAFNLAPLCRYLFPIPLLFFTFYPYTKRFTWLCHFFLGFTLGLAPLAGWIAVANSVTVVPLLLLLGVALWVSGFDIYYAFADIDFDRKEGVFSIPARFGEKKSVYLAWILHFLTVIPLVSVGLLLELSWIYYLGLFIAFSFLWGLDFYYSPLKKKENVDAYLQKNGYFSLIYFFFTFLSLRSFW